MSCKGNTTFYQWGEWCESESEVAQSCPTLFDPMDYSPPGSSVRGIFQAIVLEWFAISFSRGSSRPRDRTQVSCIVGRRFTVWATRESPGNLSPGINPLFIFKSESESEVAQSCSTLCDPMDCSPPGSSNRGIFQAIVLEWIAISFSRGSSRPRDRTRVSRIVDRRFTILATREVPNKIWNASRICESSLPRGHANLCIVPILDGALQTVACWLWSGFISAVLLFSHKRGLLHVRTATGRREGKFVSHCCARKKKKGKMACFYLL